jgi:molybdate transport system substrate-binding protein
LARRRVRLFAAGSLKAALSDIATAFEKATGIKVDGCYGPSGLMCERIEAGEAVDIFASADMNHPEHLRAVGHGRPVVRFAGNRLCALHRPGLALSSVGLLSVMLDPAVTIATSTPKADPSGDYAFALFAKAEGLKPGSRAVLEAKAIQIATAGPDSIETPPGRNAYAWIIESGMADLVLTYYTNAIAARVENAEFGIVEVPAPLAVGADYGLIVLDDAPPEAQRLAEFIRSEPGREILRGRGFVC